MSKFEKRRQEMIKSQMAARGLDDPILLKAIDSVPREKFVPGDLIDSAYRDSPLPIEANQTISQPYIVALMTNALKLKPTDRVLEIGTGSGYAAAILAEIAHEVYTIERHQILANTAKTRLKNMGYENIHVMQGDGSLGWPEHAPFDAIVVTAAGPDVPQSLKEQLAVGGRLVIPVGSSQGSQSLVRVRRISENKFEEENLGGVRFVPLIGEEGWED